MALLRLSTGFSSWTYKGNVRQRHIIHWPYLQNFPLKKRLCFESNPYNIVLNIYLPGKNLLVTWYCHSNRGKITNSLTSRVFRCRVRGKLMLTDCISSGFSIVKMRRNFRSNAAIAHIKAAGTLPVLGRGADRGGHGPLQFSGRQTIVRFQQTHNQGLRQLFLTGFWDLRT